MNLLDMRTLNFNHFVTQVLITLFIALLWSQNRKRYAGLGFWLSDFILQSVGLLLIALGNILPDLVSIVLAETLIAAGSLCLLLGLERFAGQAGRQMHNYASLGVFMGLMAYFTFVQPDSSIRTVLVSVIPLLLFGQCSWLLLRRVPPAMRHITHATGVVSFLFVLAAFVQTIGTTLIPLAARRGLLEMPVLEVVFLFINQVLDIMLTFTLVMMVTRRLAVDVQTAASAHRRMEQSLAESQQRFALAFRASPNALTVTRVSDGQILEVNEGFTTLSGYTADECVGRTTLELKLWLDELEHRHVMAELAAGRPVTGMEIQLRRRNGEIGTGLLSANIFVLGDQVCALGSINDITERKQAEQALVESEARARALYQAIPDLVFRLNRQGVFLDFKADENDLYTHPARIIGHPYGEILPPDLVALMEAPLRATFETGQLQAFEYQLPIPGLGLHAYEARLVRSSDQELIAFVRDITERKQAEATLQQSLREIARGQQTLQTLSLAARAAQTAHTARDIYQAVGHEVKKLGFKMVVLQLDSQTQELSFVYGNLNEKLLHTAERLFGFSLNTFRTPLIAGSHYDQILSDGKARLYEDSSSITVSALPAYLRPFSGALLNLFGIRQGIYAPLVVRGLPHGIIFISGKDLEEADVPAVEILAAQLGIALENAQLYESLQRELSERRQVEEGLRLSEERLSLAISSSRQGLMDWNIPRNILYLSPKYYELSGYAAGEVHPDRAFLLSLVHPKDRPAVEQALRAHLEGQSPFADMEYRMERKTGGYIWVHAVGRIVDRDQQGSPLRMLGTITDITERVRAEEMLRLQATALQSSATPIVITDRQGALLWVNSAFLKLSGYTVEEVLGKNPSVLLKSGKQDQKFYRTLWETILAGEIWHGEIINRRKDHSQYAEEMTITPVRDPHGIISHFVAIKQDITERNHRQQELKELSIHDALTGLYNRRFFEEEMARLEGGRNYPVSLIMADLNGLKGVNDRDGHAAGDALIRRAAEVLDGAFRAGDVVARMGGDEFAVLLPNTNAAAVQKMLARVQSRLDKHNASHDGPPLSLAIGDSTVELNGSLSDALHEADARMYADKVEKKKSEKAESDHAQETFR